MNQCLDLTDDDIRCPSCKTDDIIGVEVWGKYDGVLYWECLGCGHRWHRWPEGHYLRARAEPYIQRPEPSGPAKRPRDHVEVGDL
jgi:Zn ribbon nucleic-acid-binding protein